MRRKFTLLELIAVVAAVAVLAGIVIPNIGGFQSHATKTAVSSSARNVQTAVDLFSTENYGRTPTSVSPTEFIPQRVDFTLLEESHLRSLPDVQGINYWVDFTGRVWASFVDAPDMVVTTGGTITWRAVPGATHYVVYEVVRASTAGSLSGISLAIVTETTATFYAGVDGRDYVVSAVDTLGLQTAPTGTGYIGEIPVAVISVTPLSGSTTESLLSFSSEQSFSPDGERIVLQEWSVNGVAVDWGLDESLHLHAGDHEISLRVKNERGVFSLVTSQVVRVEVANRPPVAVIGMTPELDLNAGTTVSWDYSGSSDPDGHALTAEWQNMHPSYAVGSHTVSLRVRDSLGLWSPWVERTFEVFDTPWSSVSSGHSHTLAIRGGQLFA